MRVASLPMYDVHELRGETDALWAALVRALDAVDLPGAPAALERERPHREVWSDPGLLLTQTCGYPLVRALAGRVRVVGTPRYAAPECVGAWYTSKVVVRVDSPIHRLEDAVGAVCAANEADSHSGMNAFRGLIAPLVSGRGGRFFSRVHWSGSHRASLSWVASGEADVTAVDCVTFALLARVCPDLTSAVREIARTAPCPGLPLVTRASATDDEVARMRMAIAAVMADPTVAAARAALLIDGFEVLPDRAYRTVVELEASAIRQGYPDLA